MRSGSTARATKVALIPPLTLSDTVDAKRGPQTIQKLLPQADCLGREHSPLTNLEVDFLITHFAAHKERFSCKALLPSLHLSIFWFVRTKPGVVSRGATPDVPRYRRDLPEGVPPGSRRTDCRHTRQRSTRPQAQTMHARFTQTCTSFELHAHQRVYSLHASLPSVVIAIAKCDGCVARSAAPLEVSEHSIQEPFSRFLFRRRWASRARPRDSHCEPVSMVG